MAGEPILVVDDAPVDLKFMRLVLAHEGYAVRTAGSAEEAFEMLSVYRPDLILAHVRLPGMDGLEMARRIKQDPRTQSIKVLALTAVAGANGNNIAVGAGCDGSLSKPLDTTELAARVRELLDRPAAPPATLAQQDLFGPCISGPEFDHLRRSFLNEGTERIRQLLNTVGLGFDAAQARRFLHAWVGTGGLLGFNEISQLARAAEEMLREGNYHPAGIRTSLTALLDAFSEMRAASNVPIPLHVAVALRGKRTALVGFSQDRADFMCSSLGQVEARPRLFAATDNPGSSAIAECDLVVVHVRPETRDCEWLNPACALPPSATLVLAGDRCELLNLPSAVQSRDVEFLVDTWHPEEVLMRLHMALSRKGSTAAAPAAPAPVAVAAAVEALAPAAPVPVQPQIARSSVVLADDDNLILTIVGSTLRNYGMSCHAAPNGLDALKMIREVKPQIAVLDVNMPGLDGYEVLAAIRAENLPVMVVLLTARQREEDILRGFQLGADDYLVKPFNPLELVARLKRLMKR